MIVRLLRSHNSNIRTVPVPMQPRGGTIILPRDQYPDKSVKNTRFCHSDRLESNSILDSRSGIPFFLGSWTMANGFLSAAAESSTTLLSLYSQKTTRLVGKKENGIGHRFTLNLKWLIVDWSGMFDWDFSWTRPSNVNQTTCPCSRYEQ